MVEINKKRNMEKDQAIEVVIIGAGTAVPSLGRSPASVLLKAGDFMALLDIGPGTISKLPQFGVDTFKLQNILITHLHPDHILDLIMFFLLFDINPLAREGIPLNLVGCKGLADFIQNSLKLFPDINPPSFPINIHEVSDGEIKLNGVRVLSTLSNHTETSVSYRIVCKDKAVVYTGDCVKSPQLEEFCSRADLLISECSFPDDQQTKDHMNAKSLGELSEVAGVKQLIVTHLYPSALDVDLKTQIEEYFHGPVLIAKDGTSYKF